MGGIVDEVLDFLRVARIPRVPFELHSEETECENECGGHLAWRGPA